MTDGISSGGQGEGEGKSGAASKKMRGDGSSSAATDEYGMAQQALEAEQHEDAEEEEEEEDEDEDDEDEDEAESNPKRLQKKLLALSAQLEDLRAFMEINTTAVIKIGKKFDKQILGLIRRPHFGALGTPGKSGAGASAGGGRGGTPRAAASPEPS